MTRIDRRPAVRQAGCALALLALAPATLADSFQLATGTDYSSGRFGGTTKTEVIVVPVSARLKLGDWSIKASVPWLNIKGPADVAVILDDGGGSSSGSGSSGSNSSGSSSGGSGSSGSGSSGSGSDDRGGNDSYSPTRSTSGIGDTTLTITRSFDALGGSPIYIDAIGRVKLPSGKTSSGLGTGTTDYTAAAELGWAGDHAGVYGAGGRRFLGSTSTLRRNDAWQWSGGGWVSMGKLELGVDYTWREATVAGGIASRAVEGNLNIALDDYWRIGAYGGVGLSNGAPDYAAGLSLAWQIPL